MCYFVHFETDPSIRHNIQPKEGQSMLADSLVEEVRCMLREGRLSQRSIARRLKISRGTVNAIAQGRRRDASERRESRLHPREEGGFIPPSGSPRRCPGCGGLTQMPCLACYLRSRHESRRRCSRPSCGGGTNHDTIAAASAG